MAPIIIAVDGPAGSGKSSVSKQVASRLHITYIDSGAIYRAITWYVLDAKKQIDLQLNILDVLKDVVIDQHFSSDGITTTTINGQDVSQEIRSEDVVKNISIISSNTDARDYVTSLLRRWAEKKSIIMDGRDIGSVVFPHANLKVFLDASVEIRAERRVNEYAESGKKVDLNDVKNQIILRDDQDRSREYGALIECSDAVKFDTSLMTQEQVIEKFVALINEKLN